MSRAKHIAKHFEGVLRHPDGSVDIAAYARIAHRERAAALASAARAAIGMVREMLSGIRARLAPVESPTRLPESITPLPAGRRAANSRVERGRDPRRRHARA